jgi:hypothetical protein
VAAGGLSVEAWRRPELDLHVRCNRHRGLLVSELDRHAQVRFAKLEGDLLTLSTKPMTFQGMERTAELVWERVGQD